MLAIREVDELFQTPLERLDAQLNRIQRSLDRWERAEEQAAQRELDARLDWLQKATPRIIAGLKRLGWDGAQERPRFIKKRYEPRGEPAVAGVDEERRTFRCVVSATEEDRSGDVVSARGINFDNYMRFNPVLLPNHDSEKSFPIGRCISLKYNAAKDLLEGEFEVASGVQAADDAWALIRGGFIKGVSVGFVPTAEPRSRPGAGYYFSEIELLEISLVSVPCLPSAVITEVGQAA